jgi:hypothetical protein
MSETPISPRERATPMKKRIVITTEKHEVWIIRREGAAPGPDEHPRPARMEDDPPEQNTEDDSGHGRARPPELKE